MSDNTLPAWVDAMVETMNAGCAEKAEKIERLGWIESRLDTLNSQLARMLEEIELPMDGTMAGNDMRVRPR